MYGVLVTILILISVVLIAAILLQSGKGGGLAASFGGASSSAELFMGTRQTANLLTRISWWGGGAFLVLGLVLSIMSTRQSRPRSVLDRPAASQPVAPAPATPGTPAPAVPLEPAGTPPAAEKAPAPTKTP